ncbi:hypothetical protein ACHQM5_023356 [Ranunculus cassubicifolius]
MDMLNQMSVAAILVGTLFFLLFFFGNTLWNWKIRNTTNSKVAIPEPAGAWPIVGHLLMLSDPAVAHLVFGRLADKYGPAFMVRLGFYKALVVSSSDVARECFTTNDKNFATRSRSNAAKIMAYDYAMFGLAPYGSYWRESRKIAILELLSSHRLELLKDVRMSEVKTSLTDLYQICQRKSGNSYEPVLVEMKQWFGAFTLNVIVRMIAGKRYSNTSTTKLHDYEEGRRLQKEMHNLGYLFGVFVLADAIPALGWLDFKGHLKAMKRTAKEIDSIFDRWLEEHRQNILADGSKVDKDFIYVLLSIVGDYKISQYESDVVIKGICLNLILGANDTTTATLTWALSLLLNHRHVLKKVQDEIENNVGKDRQVEESDIEKLVYLQAIVKETMRLYPAAPLSAPHEAIKDCTVAGYHVPAGTQLLTNISKIQRDPRIWSNPNEFQPERFLSTQANVDVRGQHFELIPFGSGRRSCPGISFALQVIHLVLARLLHGFDFETPNSAPVDMTGSAGLMNLKATPLEVLITPRLEQYLY